jgi:hypothetical protein
LAVLHSKIEPSVFGVIPVAVTVTRESFNRHVAGSTVAVPLPAVALAVADFASHGEVVVVVVAPGVWKPNVNGALASVAALPNETYTLTVPPSSLYGGTGKLAASVLAARFALSI